MTQKTSLALLLNGLVQNQNLANSGDQYVFDSIMVGGVSGTALTESVLDGLVSNSHAPSSDNQSIVAGNGMTGGGSGAIVTLNVGAGNGISSSGTTVSVVAQPNQGITVGSSGVAVDYDNSSIGIVGSQLAVLTGGITDSMLAGGIDDTKLNQITTANTVAGAAVQLNSTGGLQNSTGLEVKLDGTTLSVSSSGIKVNSIADAQISSGAAIALSKLASLTASKALVSDGSGVVSTSSVTSTELGYVSGVSSGIQTQFSGKLSLSGGSMSGAIDMGSNKITSLATPTNAGDAATKNYVDTLVVTGSKVKAAVLTAEQLSNTQGILGAEILDLDALPLINDTLSITDGTHTETYTYSVVAGGSYPNFTVVIGTDVPTTYANLVTSINTNSLYWAAVDDSSYTAIDPDDTDGIIIIYDKTSTTSPSTSRLYGTSTSSPVAEIISFTDPITHVADIEYSTNKAETNLPSTDPGFSAFGFNEHLASLEDGEIHITLDNDSLLSWNLSLSAWVTLSSNAVPDATSGVGGATHGKVTADSSKGLTISSGVMTVEVDSSSIGFNGSGELEVLANGITDSMLVGSIDDGKLSTISATNKVSGSAVQLNANGGLQNSTGLELKLDGSTLSISSSGVKVSSGGITNTEVNASAAIDESKLNLSYSTSSLNTAISGKASKALDNLTSVAINADLLPGSSGGAALGSSSKMFAGAFLSSPLSLYNTTSASFPVRLLSPSGVTAQTDFTLPAVHGSSGQVLYDTTGGGVLGWQTVLSGPISDSDVASNAAIEYSKLSLTNSIVNADISSSAAIADTKLAQLTTSNKVAGTAVQLASGGGIQNSSGLEVKVSDFAGNGLQDNGSNALTLKLADSSLNSSSSGASVNFAPTVSILCTSGQSFAANTTYLVRWALSSETAGRIYAATNANAATDGKFYAFGIVNSTVAVNASNSVAVTIMGVNTLGNSDTLFNSADVGKAVYLTTGGGFSVTPPSSTGTAVWRIGMVTNTNTMFVGSQQLNGIN